MTGRVDPHAIEEHIAKVVPLMRPGPRIVSEDEADLTVGVTAPAMPAALDEAPDHLLEVPGLVGQITRWLVGTALYPQPLLALGAALAVVGTAAGRKYAGPTKSGTHLYVLGLAATGAGKNHPPKLAKRLMAAANMVDLIGPGQFMSEPAVYQRVSAAPLMLCFMDEFGSYLQRINDPKGAGGYAKAISGALRSFWGASFETIYPPAWADSSATKLKPIQSPALSIYGMSVHEEFYAALQSADIANGFLNRFLILSTQHKPEEVDPELDENVVPTALIVGLQNIASTAYDASRSRRQADTWEADIMVPWATPEAQGMYRAFRKAVDARGEDAKLYSRVPEMAVRLATIRAIGRAKDGRGASVALDDIQWGCELALCSADRMAADALSYMVESEHQARVNEVIRYIRASGGKITRSDLGRKLKHKLTGQQVAACLESLRDTDQIDISRVTSEGATKPTDFIRWTG